MTNVPFYKPNLPKKSYSKVSDVLKSGWITTGPKVKEFEQGFSKLLNAQYCLAVSSCTAALHLAYLSQKIKPGDEVIVPSFTFCSTINTIEHLGAKPVFSDIDENTLCVSPESIKQKITKKTKAIVIVHFAGMPADMDAINEIAQEHHIPVIEDAAHAFLTKYKGKYIGEGSNLTCFSFYATKNLTTAEGGMIVTSEESLKEYFEVMRMHGISKNAWKRYTKNGSWKYDVIAPGYKYNMTDIQAVIGIEQLKHANNVAKKRQELARTYKSLLENNDNIILPLEVPYEKSQHAWHIFTIRLKETSNISRDELIEKLKEKNIGTSVHFIPNHIQTYYKNKYGYVKLKTTETVYNSILSLPFYETLNNKQVKYVCKQVNKWTS